MGFFDPRRGTFARENNEVSSCCSGSYGFPVEGLDFNGPGFSPLTEIVDSALLEKIDRCVDVIEYLRKYNSSAGEWENWTVKQEAQQSIHLNPESNRYEVARNMIDGTFEEPIESRSAAVFLNFMEELAPALKVLRNDKQYKENETETEGLRLADNVRILEERAERVGKERLSPDEQITH